MHWGVNKRRIILAAIVWLAMVAMAYWGTSIVLRDVQRLEGQIGEDR
jgi:hypothetical protein